MRIDAQTHKDEWRLKSKEHGLHFVLSKKQAAPPFVFLLWVVYKKVELVPSPYRSSDKRESAAHAPEGRVLRFKSSEIKIDVVSPLLGFFF